MLGNTVCVEGMIAVPFDLGGEIIKALVESLSPEIAHIVNHPSLPGIQRPSLITHKTIMGWIF